VGYLATLSSSWLKPVSNEIKVTQKTTNTIFNIKVQNYKEKFERDLKNNKRIHDEKRPNNIIFQFIFP
jgi:hypothetical protein